LIAIGFLDCGGTEDLLSESPQGSKRAGFAYRSDLFAGPLFTQAEWRWNKELAASLEHKNCTVILPQQIGAGSAPIKRRLLIRKRFMTGIFRDREGGGCYRDFG